MNYASLVSGTPQIELIGVARINRDPHLLQTTLPDACHLPASGKEFPVGHFESWDFGVSVADLSQRILAAVQALAVQTGYTIADPAEMVGFYEGFKTHTGFEPVLLGAFGEATGPEIITFDQDPKKQQPEQLRQTDLDTLLRQREGNCRVKFVVVKEPLRAAG